MLPLWPLFERRIQLFILLFDRILSTEMQQNRLGVNLWLKWSLFYSINESVSYLFISAAEPACSACATTTSACCSTCVVCRFVNGRNVRQMGGWLIDGPMVGPRND